MQCEKWLKAVLNLRVDRKETIAPHKPLLLLVLAELAEGGKLSSTFLPLTGELVFRFLAYWTVVAERRTQRPDIHLPFYHMRSDGCWTPLDADGQPTLERRRAVAAELDKTFLACLNDQDFRTQMRRILIAKYFPDYAERAALYQLVGLPLPPDAIVREDARLREILVFSFLRILFTGQTKTILHGIANTTASNPRRLLLQNDLALKSRCKLGAGRPRK